MLTNTLQENKIMKELKIGQDVKFNIFGKQLTGKIVAIKENLLPIVYTIDCGVHGVYNKTLSDIILG